MNPAKYLISLGRRLAIALLDATVSFAKNETVVFGAFCTGLGTAAALKIAESVGYTLPASALAFVGAAALAVSALLIRQFVGSATFVEEALQKQEDAANAASPPAK